MTNFHFPTHPYDPREQLLNLQWRECVGCCIVDQAVIHRLILDLAKYADAETHPVAKIASDEINVVSSMKPADTTHDRDPSRQPFEHRQPTIIV